MTFGYNGNMSTTTYALNRSVDQDSPVPARTRRPVCWSGRGMSPNSSKPCSGWPAPAPNGWLLPADVWELEQRLQKVCPLERPGYLGTAASALRRRPGSGIPASSTAPWSGPIPTPPERPPKRRARRPRPWAGAAAFSTEVHVSVDALGQSLAVHPDWGAKARHHPGPGA